ncbi:MAG: hypothetical protein R3E68_00125 [Burkholderiaceae bacterium]
MPANSVKRINFPNACIGPNLRFMTPYEMLPRAGEVRAGRAFVRASSPKPNWKTRCWSSLPGWASPCASDEAIDLTASSRSGTPTTRWRSTHDSPPPWR